MIDKVIFDKLMMRYSHLGTMQAEPTGAFLVGYAPHIASEAWLNTTFQTLSEKEIIELEEQLGTNIPSEYRLFLQYISNGMNVLVDELCLFGKRNDYSSFGFNHFALKGNLTPLLPGRRRVVVTTVTQDYA